MTCKQNRENIGGAATAAYEIVHSSGNTVRAKSTALHQHQCLPRRRQCFEAEPSVAADRVTKQQIRTGSSHTNSTTAPIPIRACRRHSTAYNAASSPQTRTRPHTIICPRWRAVQLTHRHDATWQAAWLRLVPCDGRAATIRKAETDDASH
jgi:hypothetical protein